MTKSPNIFWRNKVFSNKIRRFRQILVAFSEYVNFSLGYSISESAYLENDIASKLSFMEFWKKT